MTVHEERPQEWTIYGLADPRDMVVRYVGCTYHLKMRLGSHMWRSAQTSSPKSKWIQGLLAEGVKPVAVVLEEMFGKAKKASKAERAWIRKLPNLLNVSRGGVSSTVGPMPGGEPWREDPAYRAKVSAGMREAWNCRRRAEAADPSRVADAMAIAECARRIMIALNSHGKPMTRAALMAEGVHVASEGDRRPAHDMVSCSLQILKSSGRVDYIDRKTGWVTTESALEGGPESSRIVPLAQLEESF